MRSTVIQKKTLSQLREKVTRGIHHSNSKISNFELKNHIYDEKKIKKEIVNSLLSVSIQLQLAMILLSYLSLYWVAQSKGKTQ